MKIAVTGASGFMGTELLANLHDRKIAEVAALARDTSLYSDTDCCKWVETDYSEDSLKEVLRDTDAIIHLAGVRGTEDNPNNFSPNIVITENILKAMVGNAVKRIVFSSSVSVYNGEDQMPWKEEASIGGYRAYGNSKAMCETTIKRYAHAYGITYGIARIAQVLGEGERRRAMMNVFLDTAKEHGTLKVMGKSVAVKQYIYIRDLINILLKMTVVEYDNKWKLAEKNQVINVGMPHAYTNLEIAQMVNKVYGNDMPIEYDDSYPETGRAFFMDITRLRKDLGYEPLDMKEALQHFAHKEN